MIGLANKEGGYTLGDQQAIEDLSLAFLEALYHRKTQEQLQESEKQFRAIADYTYGWESWLGSDGQPLWVNPMVERFTGYTVEECLAMPDYPLPLIHEDDLRDAGKVFHQAIEGKTTGNDFSFRIRRKDGSVLWMAVSWQPMYDSQGVYIGIRYSSRDITDREIIWESSP